MDYFKKILIFFLSISQYFPTLVTPLLAFSLEFFKKITKNIH
jgi:hypothetical protein